MFWLVLAACSGSEPTESAAAQAFDGGWTAALVREPDTFAARVGENRDGWIALHRNDWPAAVASGGDPARRAHAELARFYAVLGGASQTTWQRLGSRWSDRGLAANSAVVALAHSAELDAAVSSGAPPWSGPASEFVAARTLLHAAVRDGKKPAADLVAVAGDPLIVEAGDGVERRISDPWILRSLALAEAMEAERNPPADAVLFSGALNVDAQPLPLPPAARASGTPAEDAVTDADACRARVRALDGDLDAWRTSLSGSATPAGKALLTDLRLVDGTRTRMLVDMAVSALSASRAGCALALAQLALDHESPRAVGPLNSPTLFAVLASAQLTLGRSREALDALEALVETYPAVASLDDTVGTLVVLEGLDRRGDSRE